jgi:hypothetical protein
MLAYYFESSEVLAVIPLMTDDYGAFREKKKCLERNQPWSLPSVHHKSHIN